MAQPPVDIRDPGYIYRLGNVTTGSTNEVLGSSRTYNEPGSQAQRSVKSSSANDSNPSGSGAKKVTIVYLDSNYVLKQEEVTLNGTTAVNTVASDIRFIENFYVSAGAAAAGAIELFPNTGGTGTAICGIGAGTEQMFFPHHYVPAGKKCYILGWSASHDDECAFKLKTQWRPNGTDLVELNTDLRKVYGVATPPGDLSFDQDFLTGIPVPEKTRIWITVVPGQNTNTIIRTHLNLWEESAS